MQSSRRTTFLALITSSVFMTGVAQAGIVSIYTDEATFNGAVGGTTVESFEGVADGTALPLTVGGMTVSTDNATFGGFNAVNSLLATDGSQSVRYGADDGDSIFFAFDNAIDAFGVNIGDFGTTGGNPLLTFFDALGNSVGVLAGTMAGSNFEFFGVTLNPGVVGVQFTYTGAGGDGLYFDEVYSRAATANVPEPGSLALLGLGLAGMGLARRRMKS